MLRDLFWYMFLGMIGWAAIIFIIAFIEVVFRSAVCREKEIMKQAIPEEWARASRAAAEAEKALKAFREADDKTKRAMAKKLEEIEKREVRP